MDEAENTNTKTYKMQQRQSNAKFIAIKVYVFKKVRKKPGVQPHSCDPAV